MTQPAKVLHMPITSSDPHKGVPPTAYVWRMRRQHCQRCGYYFESLDLFAETWIRNSEHGKAFRNYRPMHGEFPHWNLPVRTEPMELQQLPFCSECSTGALSHLPEPSKSHDRIVGLYNKPFADALDQRARGEATGATHVKRKPHPASIDDIAKDLGL